MTLILTPLAGLPIIKPGDDLADLIADVIKHAEMNLADGDILVIAQKIISKSEDRFVNLNDISPSERALELAQHVDKDARLIELVIEESKSILRYRSGTIIVEHRLGFVCANAGIDHSNVRKDNDSDQWVLLLPENPDRSADGIRRSLEKWSNKRIGVMVIDSHG